MAELKQFFVKGVEIVSALVLVVYDAELCFISNRVGVI
jgi:hypothetical protein